MEDAWTISPGRRVFMFAACKFLVIPSSVWPNPVEGTDLKPCFNTTPFLHAAIRLYERYGSSRERSRCFRNPTLCDEESDEEKSAAFALIRWYLANTFLGAIASYPVPYVLA